MLPSHGHVQGREAADVDGAEELQAGHDLCPLIADPRRRGDGREGVLRPASQVVDELAGEGGHGQVGDLDAAEAVFAAQLDASMEATVGRDHPAARVLGVAQPPERPRLQLRRVRSPRARARQLVLAQASLEPTEREVKVAAQMVDVRQLRGEIPLGRQGLGRIERRERLIEAVRDTHPRGKAAPGPATLAVVDSGLKGASVRVH